MALIELVAAAETPRSAMGPPYISCSRKTTLQRGFYFDYRSFDLKNITLRYEFRGLVAAAWDAHRYHLVPNAQSSSGIMNLPDSTMTETKRAQNVCHACMLRKKRCNKALPACGFCASRQLLCRYDISAPKSKGRRTYNPGRHFVPLRSPSPQSISSQAKTVTRQLPFQQDHNPIHHSSLYLFPQSAEESLDQLAQQFSNLTSDDIVDRFFHAFHKWLPVVSPDSFCREASRYREEGRLPPADFKVLVLAMLLSIFPTLDPSLRSPRASQELLYMTTKSAFSQAQASICTSLRLAQAALLIALCEYTSVRPEAAYISTMTCAGLARVMGIRTVSVRTTRDARKTNDSRLEEMERENLSWTIAMLER